MEQTVNKLSLDVSKNESAINEIVRLRQGDKQSHTIEANVTNHQKAYNLTDLSVEFQATKPDGQVVIDNATIKDASGGIISYRINNEVTAAAGKMTGYFTIKNGSNVVDSTASFNIIVEPSVSVNSVSGTYISTVDELISTLRQQVDTFKQESNTKIDNVQNEINTLNTTLTSAVSSAKDTATKAVIADLQTKLDKLLEQANGTKQSIDTLANNLNSQLTSKVDAAESLKSQIENDKSSAQTTLQSLNSIRDQGTTILNNFKTNTEKALSDLTTNVDGLVKKAISDNSEAFSNLQTNAQQLVTNLTSQLSDVKSKSDSWTNSSNSALDSFKTNSQQQLNSNIQTNNQAYTDAINAWKTKADKAISDFTTQAGNIINVKSATVNGGDKVTPDSTGNLSLTVPNPDLSGYLTKTESNNNLSANYYNKHEVDDKLALKGNVKSVNGVQPDNSGNAQIDAMGNTKLKFNTLIQLTNNATTVTNTDLVATKQSDGSYKIDNSLDHTSLNVANNRHSINLLNGSTKLDNPDPNTITNTGHYYISNARSSNLPTNSWGVLNVFYTGSIGDTRVAQVYYEDNSINAWYRSRQSNQTTWNAWKRILTDDDLNNLNRSISNAGKVKTVNGIQPNSNGEITISGLTKSVQINGNNYTPDSNGKVTVSMPFLSSLDVVKGYNIATGQPMNAASGQTISSDGHNSGWLVDGNALQPFAASINNLESQLNELKSRPTAPPTGITDVDGTHHDVKFLSQSDYDALSTKDPNTLYITPES